MIITLTGNLLAERTFEFSSWEPGKTQRAARESFQVGGKGINVSRMLTRLGARTLALCFAGGASGGECLRWLGQQGIGHHAFQTSMPTRTGLVVVARAVAAASSAGGRGAGTSAVRRMNIAMASAMAPAADQADRTISWVVMALPLK